MGGEVVENAAFLWRSPAPSRVRFFAWLLTLGRIHTRDNLLKKHIVELQSAGCPECGVSLETPDHLIFGCPFARAFWCSLRLSTSGASVRAMHLFDASMAVGSASPHAFVQLCCWHLWKRRNAVVFRRETPSLNATLKACRDDAILWRGRFRSADRGHVDAWLMALRG
ncbi:uncharacterized protein [Aegilops tauschii subsp. strangulata]|uniref:uncharacterized protein n=1 Tax=Aegilops tauschii subsp. strangulata TaxID=200361 RepID=UPI00098AA4BF|nr:uncharacterized protein LOC109777832 [Aegilops tauschii subsp. strangulata]